jgi:hypothetical protein
MKQMKLKNKVIRSGEIFGEKAQLEAVKQDGDARFEKTGSVKINSFSSLKRRVECPNRITELFSKESKSSFFR